MLGDLTRMKMDWVEAEGYYQAAIAREPRNPTSHLWYGEFLTQVGRLEDAIQETRIAYDLDPLSPGANINLAYLHMYTGRYDEAGKLLQAGKELGHDGGLLGMILIQLNKGDHAHAYKMLTEIEQSLNVTEGSFAFVLKALLDGTQDAAAARLLSDEYQEWPNAVAYSLIDLGHFDDAFSFINARLGIITGNGFSDMWDGRISAFRRDPRFVELIHRLGLDEYWRLGHWPDLCRPEGETIICR